MLFAEYREAGVEKTIAKRFNDQIAVIRRL